MNRGSGAGSRQKTGLFLTSLITLLLEITLTKVFDVILEPNLAYMVISAAMFAFGLAGILLMKIQGVSERDG